MPGFDKTGPSGKGPSTGRGVGDCEVAEKQLDRTRPRRGKGRPSGLGLGRSRGRRKGQNGITYFV
ncbi:MAG: DUF5320 domain-containing protein [bacterium]